MKTQKIEICAINSPTVLGRVLQIVKRRRINIQLLTAEENKVQEDDMSIQLILHTDKEQARLLKTQFEKQVDVIKVK